VSGWGVSDSAVSLAVIILSMVLLPTRVRRSVGGSTMGYVALMCGLGLMAVTPILNLLATVWPLWAAHLPEFGFYFPIHAGGYVLILAGSLVMVRDWVRAKTDALESAEQERVIQFRLRGAKAELERANAELAHLAATDPLTGLANRRQADVLLAREAARGRRQTTPVAVVMIDIDHFKSINDTYGHTVGDAVLGHLAERLQSRVRASDIVVRYGGEEFLLILPETDYDGAVGLAETLRECIEAATFSHGNKQLILTGSFGVAVLKPSRNSDFADAVRKADEAMYAAKSRGRNRVVSWTEIAPAPARNN
jgi:diguanylate cyclase (GGDEF)-like protein